ncbi:MAG: hypothetical protein Q7J57_16370 [Gemmobacter sp.]|nr:hypothetical protein [Gemmobacter sp.]
MSLYSNDRHKRATRLLGFAQTAGAPDLWHTARRGLTTCLTTAEASSIAFAALLALDPADREMTFNAAHWGVL